MNCIALFRYCTKSESGEQLVITKPQNLNSECGIGCFIGNSVTLVTEFVGNMSDLVELQFLETIELIWVKLA